VGRAVCIHPVCIHSVERGPLWEQPSSTVQNTWSGWRRHVTLVTAVQLLTTRP
jgi:hypothetical protein